MCSFDVRGKPLSEGQHWSALGVFGPRAHFVTSPPPAALHARREAPRRGRLPVPSGLQEHADHELQIQPHGRRIGFLFFLIVLQEGCEESSDRYTFELRFTFHQLARQTSVCPFLLVSRPSYQCLQFLHHELRINLHLLYQSTSNLILVRFLSRHQFWSQSWA
ncbi:hypothetical protein EVAR_93749_1 [Eumeta japonica]|uniref:Uncharacterized protein n=1 Tax=Eumeta variegata TaxID=151549 RepID=A0A4C1TIW5_EUMVA|nr:hypothetical protein EVAR_93749_1 [Eumeta japonica]